MRDFEKKNIFIAESVSPQFLPELWQMFETEGAACCYFCYAFSTTEVYSVPYNNTTVNTVIKEPYIHHEQQLCVLLKQGKPTPGLLKGLVP